jgi:hypothetical protein
MNGTGERGENGEKPLRLSLCLCVEINGEGLRSDEPPCDNSNPGLLQALPIHEGIQLLERM